MNKRDDLKFGDKVHYCPDYGPMENGKVKSVPGDGYAFVVYNCAGNWDQFEDYTAARTKLSDLKKGWSDEAKTSTKY